MPTNPNEDDDDTTTGGSLRYWLDYKVIVGKLKIAGKVVLCVAIAAAFVLGLIAKAVLY